MINLGSLLKRDIKDLFSPLPYKPNLEIKANQEDHAIIKVKENGRHLTYEEVVLLSVKDLTSYDPSIFNQPLSLARTPDRKHIVARLPLLEMALGKYHSDDPATLVLSTAYKILIVDLANRIESSNIRQ